MPRQTILGPDTVLEAAKDRVTILDAARRLGFELRRGLNRSPFRDDKKPSFSVYAGRDGRERFKDHAHDEHRGGVWDFVQLAQPGLQARDVRAWLLEAAGLKDDPAARPKLGRDTLRAMTRKQVIEQERGREAALTIVTRPPPAPVWSMAIRDQYAEGWRYLRDDEAYQSRLAESRGWFDPVVAGLVDAGLAAAPFLPWGGRRGVAFIVHRPETEPGTAGAELRLVPVGYHQRYMRRGHDGPQKAWLYVPNVPQDKPGLSAFQQHLLALGRSVPAYPFVMGNLCRPRVVCILEGQWDAITLAAAAEDVLAHAAVFGIRGTSGTELFLGAYGDWLRAVRPVCWVIADADAAGKRWVERRRPDPAKPAEPSFVDRLRAFSGVRVVSSIMPTARYGKDFNDYYRKAYPGPAEIAAWCKALEIPTA